jgi:4-hydroxy-3-polyprenylbenzoate decarboxylase
MKTLSAIAHGHSDDLIHRAADVVIKERKRLVLVVREAPLSEIHLEHMLKLARMGVVIMPPVPAFYDHPRSVEDIVNHTVGRVLDLFDVHIDKAARWTGAMGVGLATRVEPDTAARQPALAEAHRQIDALATLARQRNGAGGRRVNALGLADANP